MAAWQQFEVDRKQLDRTRLLQAELPPLPSGHVRMRIDRFALTANNLTYALTGDLLGYWNFFPSTDTSWGRVPAMGWAELIESDNPDLPPGGRYYGWFPMATHVDIQAVASAEGCRDDGPHRAPHAPIYRSYTLTQRDPLYQAGEDNEHRHALLRGLFLTAFLADQALLDASYHGAEQVLVLSASSKTAIAFAECASVHHGLQIVGLSSADKLDFLRHLSCYDSVLSYPDVARFAADTPTLIVDLSGNRELLARLHTHLGPALKYSMAIGRSHHDAADASIGGTVKPQFFFAPTQAKTLLKNWGAERYFAALSEALSRHIDRSAQWLQVELLDQPAALQQAWQDLYQGQIHPARGLIVGLNP